MSVECPAGWEGAPELTAPESTQTLDNDAERYTRVSYEWELADNSTPPTCPCGSPACTFNMTYGTSSDGSVSIQPFGIGGSVGGSIVGGTELSVTVGGDGFEYVGYKVVLKETTERGDFSTTGGFISGGFWSRIGFAWSFIWNGLAAIIPQMTFDDPDETNEKYTQAAWKICRRPCPVQKKPDENRTMN